MALSKGIYPFQGVVGAVKAHKIVGSFRPNGSSGIVTASQKGHGWTVARTSRGLYTVTFDEVLKRFMGARVGCRDADQLGVVAIPGDYVEASKTLQIRTQIGPARFFPISLHSARELSAADYINTAGDAGVLSKNTTPILERQNAGTDIAARISWAASNVDEIQFDPIPLPPEAVASGNPIEVHMLFSKSGNTDTAAVVQVKAMLGLGDADAGGNTTALNIAANTLTEKTVTIATGDTLAHPTMLNLSMVPGAHANDLVRLHAIWLEIPSLIDLTADVDNEVSFEVLTDESSAPVI